MQGTDPDCRSEDEEGLQINEDLILDLESS